MKSTDQGTLTATIPFGALPGIISYPRHPAVVMVHTHARPVPCCDAHARGKIKWCNAVGYKPVVSPAPYATACEGCKAEAYNEETSDA